MASVFFLRPSVPAKNYALDGHGGDWERGLRSINRTPQALQIQDKVNDTENHALQAAVANKRGGGSRIGNLRDKYDKPLVFCADGPVNHYINRP